MQGRIPWPVVESQVKPTASMQPEAPPPQSKDFKRLLSPEASDDDVRALMRAVYDQLRGLASAYLSHRPGVHTLQPTAVVHEAFIRLVGNEELTVESRGHFFSVAAKAMRFVLADHARRTRTEKRGGDWQQVTLSGIGTDGVDMAFDAADISEALEKLEGLSRRQAQIVELRFFGGMLVEEISNLIEVSERTVRNEWRVARAWLRNELDEGSSG